MSVDTKALFDAAWGAEVAKRAAESPSYEVGDFTVTGRAPAPYGKRTLEWWQDKGHEMVDRWVQWRKDNPNFVSWETPDGQPAIELKLSFDLPGGIHMLAYVDNVFANTKTGEILVVDKKTGRAHETPEQLGLYATGIELMYGEAYRPRWGYWWDATKGQHVGPMNLDRFTPEYLGSVYAEVIRGINANSFPARPANSCSNWCSVQRYCAATGGVDAPKVDPVYQISS